MFRCGLVVWSSWLGSAHQTCSKGADVQPADFSKENHLLQKTGILTKVHTLDLDVAQHVKGRGQANVHQASDVLATSTGAAAEAAKKAAQPPPDFVGCFVYDGARDLDGPVQSGYTVSTCSFACRASSTFFALHGPGRCVCGNAYATSAQHGGVSADQCVFPFRGIAVYRLSSTEPASRHQGGPDINQEVFIQNEPILDRKFVGPGALNVCRDLGEQHLSNPDPVRVCGTGIRATFFARGGCELYYEHSHTFGVCDSSAPADYCDVGQGQGLGQYPNFASYRSYLIEEC